MAYVTGLSGTEIVEDVLAQVKKKLLLDCNLRDSDSYGRGYSGQIDVKLKLYAMDVTDVNQTVEIPVKEDPPVTMDEVVVTPVTLETTVEIKQEEDLLAVRDRIEEAKNTEPEITPETGDGTPTEAPRSKRRYTRRVNSGLEQAPVAEGGAVDLDKPEF